MAHIVLKHFVMHGEPAERERDRDREKWREKESEKRSENYAKEKIVFYAFLFLFTIFIHLGVAFLHSFCLPHSHSRCRSYVGARNGALALDLNGILGRECFVSIKMRCATYAHHSSGGYSKNDDNKEILCTFSKWKINERKHFLKIATAEAAQWAKLQSENATAYEWREKKRKRNAKSHKRNSLIFYVFITLE